MNNLTHRPDPFFFSRGLAPVIGRFVLAFCLALVSFPLTGSVLPTAADDAPPTPDSVREVVRVAAATNWMPYSARDRNGKGFGVAYDLARKIFEPMGFTVEIEQDMPWRRYVAAIEDGSLDIILAAYPVDPFGVYSLPYATDEVKVFVRKGGEFPFTQIRDLADKIGVQPRGAGYDVTFHERCPDKLFTMKENGDARLCIEMVLNGDADYYVSAYYDVLAKLKAAGYEGKLVPLEHPVYVQGVVMVISRKSPVLPLLPAINQAIRRYRENRTVNRLIADFIDAR